MKIKVVNGIGTGHTELSSFDSALKDSGVYNYNLIYLSSVIPEGAEVNVLGKIHETPGKVGDRLYVVMAQERSSTPGESIGAALGWYQFGPEGGVFVEHHTKGKNPQDVKSKLELLTESSVRDLCVSREVEFQKEELKINMAITVVENKSKCAMVLAVFEHQEWQT